MRFCARRLLKRHWTRPQSARRFSARGRREQARYAGNRRQGLKIRHNNVLGYVVDGTAQHGDRRWRRHSMPPSFTARPLRARPLHHRPSFGEIEAKIAKAATAH